MKKLEEKNVIELVFVLRRDLAQTLLTSSVRAFSALACGSSPVYSVQADGADNQLSRKFEQGTVELMSHVFVVRASVESSCTRANIRDPAPPSNSSLSNQ